MTFRTPLEGLIAGAVLVCAVMFSAGPVRADAPPDPRSTTVSAQTLLADISVRAERNGGYDRDLFEHWVDADADGCDAREEVLIAESTRTPWTGPGCVVYGLWFSRYDGLTINLASGLDIDHVVALAEAWGSGARAWGPARRQRFANDLGYGPSLIAVTASSNRSKSDRDPAEWLPSRDRHRCRYVAQWIAVKWRWRLSIDSTERAAMVELMSDCSPTSLLVPRPKQP